MSLSISQLDVLLVEPSGTQQRIIQDYLSELGAHEPNQVHTAGEALAAMRNRIPDLVISAMHLPDMTGTELIQQMRNDAATLDVAFILISSETGIR